MMRPVEATVAFSARRPWVVVLLAVLATAAGGWLTLNQFEIDTDTAHLIAPTVGWRRTEIAYSHAFPATVDLLVAVVDATSPERAEEAAERLAAAASARRDLFRTVTRPGAGPFFTENGLLFLPPQDLQRTLAALDEQRGVLVPLAADPSLRGLARVIGLMVAGLRYGATTAEALAPPFDLMADTLEAAAAGRPARLSWQSLLGGGTAETGERRRLVLAQPSLDFGSLEPGEAATAFLRTSTRALGLTAENGVTVRLTGPVPLADDEFATVADGAGFHLGLTVAAVTLILFGALRSPKLMIAVLLTLVSGLVVTSGLGLLAVGRLNLISVAFFALFIGLGVDFGIQFAVRFRADRQDEPEIGPALRLAARGVGSSLTLAALSLAAGFLSFLPTDFQGVSELGLIAGIGMGVAYGGAVTLLPALIVLFRPRRSPAPTGTAVLAGIDRWILGHRVFVLGATVSLIVAAIPLLASLGFDSNPMNLRSAKVESVATFLDLSRDPDTRPDSISILTATAEAATALAGRLSALPEVGRTVFLGSFVPDGQPAKLAALRTAAEALSAVLAPPAVAPSPSDAERVTALREIAGALGGLKGTENGTVAALRLAAAADALAAGTPVRREAAEEATFHDFPRLIHRLRGILGAREVSRDTLPADLVAEWIASDGRARVEVYPRDDLNDAAANARFVSAVRAVAPDATGAPVTIVESGRTIVRAFVQAGLLSLAAITAILWVALRRLSDVVLALGPLVVAGILTLATARLVGLQLNFANIIALPLMFGVGVAFHIYYLVAWRRGVVDVLASSLTRAIFFSALTTGAAFGSLWLSNHPGTASMGELLAISLVWTLVAAFIIVPACLGPPRAQADQAA